LRANAGLWHNILRRDQGTDWLVCDFLGWKYKPAARSVQESFMPVLKADVVDLQAYRQARAKQRQSSVETTIPVSYSMQPVMMWVPFWGFVPMMMMGATGYGV
jgi:hypothetical protein